MPSPASSAEAAEVQALDKQLKEIKKAVSRKQSGIKASQKRKGVSKSYAQVELLGEIEELLGAMSPIECLIKELTKLFPSKRKGKTAKADKAGGFRGLSVCAAVAVRLGWQFGAALQDEV